VAKRTISKRTSNKGTRGDRVTQGSLLTTTERSKN
jgi:hypothetical protein